MPIITPEGVRVPAGSDNYALTEDLRRMAETTTSIATVANADGRAALAAALATAGRPPSTTDPVYAHRSDTGALETNTGGDWTTFIPAKAGHIVHDGDRMWGAARVAGDISFQVSAANLRPSQGGRALWLTPAALGFRGISSIIITAGSDSQGTGRFWPISEIYQGNLAAILATSPTTTADAGYARLHWLITGWGTPT